MSYTLQQVRDFKSWVAESFENFKGADPRELEKKKEFIVKVLEGEDDFSFSLQQLVIGTDIKTWRRQKDWEKQFSMWTIVLGFMEFCSQNRLYAQNDLYFVDHLDITLEQAGANHAIKDVGQGFMYNFQIYVSLQMAFGYYKREELAEILWEIGNKTMDAASNRTLRYIEDLVKEIKQYWTVSQV